MRITRQRRRLGGIGRVDLLLRLTAVLRPEARTRWRRRHDRLATNRSVSSRSGLHDTLFRDSFLGTVSRHYLRLPFRLRYFEQLFSIVGVLMIASLNYFIAMETRHPAVSAARQQSQSQSPMVISPEAIGFSGSKSMARDLLP